MRLPVHQWGRAWHDAPADLFTRLHAAAEEEAGQGRTVLTFTLPAKPLHRLAPAPEQVRMKGGRRGKGVGEVGAAL